MGQSSSKLNPFCILCVQRKPQICPITDKKQERQSSQTLVNDDDMTPNKTTTAPDSRSY